ncbi:hypothetical protein BD413DRAFT_446081, partial [Trametes elegans]
GSWAAGPSQPCPGCRESPPDPKYAYGGSWHGALWTPAWTGQGETPPAFTFTFTGTAVYVFNILLPDRTNAYTSTTALTFSMDGEAVGTNFEHNPHSTEEGLTEIEYNALVFSQGGLSNTQHRLEVTAVEDDSSIILLDYIVYT